MSSAPRPQTIPSRSSPENGGTDHSAGSASTTSVCPRKRSDGPSPPGDPGHEVRALGHLRDQLALDAVRLEVVAQELRRRRLVAGRVRRVDADQPLEEVGDLVAQRRAVLIGESPATRTYSRREHSRRQVLEIDALCVRAHLVALLGEPGAQRRHRRRRELPELFARIRLDAPLAALQLEIERLAEQLRTCVFLGPVARVGPGRERPPRPRADLRPLVLRPRGEREPAAAAGTRGRARPRRARGRARRSRRRRRRPRRTRRRRTEAPRSRPRRTRIARPAAARGRCAPSRAGRRRCRCRRRPRRRARPAARRRRCRKRRRGCASRAGCPALRRRGRGSARTSRRSARSSRRSRSRRQTRSRTRARAYCRS